MLPCARGGNSEGRSGGEGVVVAVKFLWWWRRHVVLLCADEVTAGVDTVGEGNQLKIIHCIDYTRMYILADKFGV